MTVRTQKSHRVNEQHHWATIPGTNGNWYWVRYPMPQLIERRKCGKMEALTLRGLKAFFYVADRDNCIRHGQQPVTRWTEMSSPVASTTAAAWSRAFALTRKALS